MKVFILLVISLFLFSCQPKAVKNIEEVKEGLIVGTLDGTLAIYPVADNAVRVKFFEGEEEPVTEFVITNQYKVPEFEVSESGKNIKLALKNMYVEVNRKTGNLSYFDAEGKLILSEKAGSRVFNADSVMGEPCYFTELKFDSPADEAIFGLGQFQDGNYNLKGVSRRLVQVNSQIAIPFIYSSKGYGLLWHQYGLTDFNPTDNFVELEKQEEHEGNDYVAEVTSTAGTQKVAQNQSLYHGKFTVKKEGEYSIFLDLGAMGNRHYVVIDGEPVIDQSNMWLPPTAGVLVNLKAGEHDVQLVCKSDNNPTLSWKLKDNTTTFRSPHAKKLDYVVFAGSADEAIASYRNITGNAPMLPKWAYGFWQCRERYFSPII
jgi:alpha-D-xyloside xylohydrolase